MRKEFADITRGFPNESSCGRGRSVAMLSAAAGRPDVCVLVRIAYLAAAGMN